MASSLKFSEIQKPNVDEINDPWVLEKCFSKIEHGKPKTFGGILRDPSIEDVEFERFNTHTPPVTANTRIVAVLGIQDQAAPSEDGWFLSGFFALWNILQGTTKHQTWLHCLDLDELVQSHTRYLHGNPYKQRKVVLDKEILDKAQNGQHCVQKTKPGSLRSTFRSSIRNECQAAHDAKDGVLILMFGHGVKAFGSDKETVIELGADQFELREFQSLTKGTNAQVTLLATQCYGGGWSCSPLANLSTMTACGPKETSLSRRFSGSLDRACGSMFTSAVIDKLTQDPDVRRRLGKLDDEDDDCIEENLLTDKQEESYAEFCRSVYDTLLRDVDRRGYEHKISFSAQEDAWSMCWKEGSGIPLHSFKEHWDQLEDWPADVNLHPGDLQNRDLYVTDEQGAEYADSRGIAMEKMKMEGTGVSRSMPFEATSSVLGKIRMRSNKNRGSFDNVTLDELISKVSRLANGYLDSYRGHDETGNDGGFHNTLRMIRSGQQRDQLAVENAFRTVRYRIDQMLTADRYLRMMDIPAPDQLSCSEFDTRGAHHRVPRETYDAIQDFIFNRWILFPFPAAGQGCVFYKGHDYVTEACYKASIPLDIVAQKLDTLATVVESETDLLVQVVLHDPDVETYRRTFLHELGVNQNNFDPTLSHCITTPSGGLGQDADSLLRATGECI